MTADTQPHGPSHPTKVWSFFPEGDISDWEWSGPVGERHHSF